MEPWEVVERGVYKKRQIAWCLLRCGEYLFYVDADHVPQHVFPSFSTTMAGGLLLLLLDNNFITLFIVVAMLLAIVACLRLNKLKRYEQKQK